VKKTNLKTEPCIRQNSELDILLARQAILTRYHSVYGFEVLYRGERFDIGNPSDGMGATGELLNNICTCVVDENLTAGYPIFINIDQQFIESPSFFPSQSDKIVLELLETVPATPEVIQKVKELRKLGFEFALDDFIFEEERMPFLPLVSIVKIDVLACSLEKIRQKLPALKEYPVILLAEKVENAEMFSQCQALGFTLFQGYYLEKPKLVRGVKIPASKQVTLKLLSELTRPDITVEEVSVLIFCDPRLALKIVLLVNSSLFSFVRKVHDVKEAVVMLGIEAVKRWAIILLLVTESESPIEIFRVLLARAKTLELFATSTDLDNQGDYFTLGLFSGLEAVLGTDIEAITRTIPMSEDITRALIRNEGVMGSLLQLIKQLEASEKYADSIMENDFIVLNSTYWQGMIWADELMETIIAP
jgi:EAL and modified HD-GYP domain-containing signal transduction protein